ncbi:MAG: 4Fe-4S dicluster domain-containing protein, partial [Bacteroidota bacterium]
AIGIPLAYIMKNKRAFCQMVCPVSLVMIPSASIGLIKLKPSGTECTECGACNKACPMDVDVMHYISTGKPVTDVECVLCDDCKHVCPVRAIK